jgi:hypothetical protein
VSVLDQKEQPHCSTPTYLFGINFQSKPTTGRGRAAPIFSSLILAGFMLNHCGVRPGYSRPNPSVRLALAYLIQRVAGEEFCERAAKAAGFAPIGADLIDRRDDPHAFTDFQFVRCNFLKASPVRAPWSVVTNPPFDHIREFCERALAIAIFKVAVLVPLRRLPAAHWLQYLPLETIWLLSPRPSMPPASYLTTGKKPRDGTQEFCWLIFNRRVIDGRPPAIRWLHRDRAAP